MLQQRTLYDKLVDTHTVHRLDSGAGPGSQIIYPAHARIRKSLGEMTRKLSDTASQ